MLLTVPVAMPTEGVAGMVDRLLEHGVDESRSWDEPLVKVMPGFEPRLGKARLKNG
jgi:hypothetical protein